MNGNERREYQRNYAQVNGRFYKRYYPKVHKAVKSLISSLIDSINRDGVRKATNDLTLTLVNEKLYDSIVEIYKKVGVHHANLNYRFIRSLVSQKGLGRNEFWIQSIIDYLKRNLLQYSVLKSTYTLRDKLLEILTNSINEGLGEYEIVQLLRESNLDKVQAQRITRTEINRAANTGVKVAAESFPYEMEKTWLSHKDMRTRGRVKDDAKDHYHMDGQTVDINGMFTDPKSGEQIEYPGAPGGSAAMVINCRCTYTTTPKRDERGMLITRNTATGVLA